MKEPQSKIHVRPIRRNPTCYSLRALCWGDPSTLPSPLICRWSPSLAAYRCFSLTACVQSLAKCGPESGKGRDTAVNARRILIQHSAKSSIIGIITEESSQVNCLLESNFSSTVQLGFHTSELVLCLLSAKLISPINKHLPLCQFWEPHHNTPHRVANNS